MNIGDKVVCVDASNLPTALVGIIQKDEIYTVRGFVNAANGKSLRLWEVNDGSRIGAPYYYGHNPNRYRKVDERGITDVMIKNKKRLKEEPVLN